MDIKELNKKLQFEFMKKHYSAIKKAELANEKLKQVPAYNKLCLMEKELIFDVAKNKFEKKSNSEQTENLKTVRELKQNLLKKLGIKKSDLTPNFECKLCDDTGFIGSNQCQCFKTKRNQEFLKEAGFNLSSTATFEHYKTNICSDENQSQILLKTKTLLETWSKNYPNTKIKNIILCGPAGVGKSYLCECMANEIIKRNFSICFLSAFDMNNMFLKYHTTFDSTKNIHLSPMLDSDILFIDDLGTEPLTNNVTLNYLYLVLSERERKSKPVIISTNLLPENLMDRYGERIYSRLANKQIGKFFKLDGKDLRISRT